MPDLQHHTARLRRLSDRTPSTVSAVPFTGSSSAAANRRQRRLAPPRTPAAARKVPPQKQQQQQPAYYGADTRSFERRSRRYVDRKNASKRGGGAPVFSGADSKAHNARMLRLMEHR